MVRLDREPRPFLVTLLHLTTFLFFPFSLDMTIFDYDSKLQERIILCFQGIWPVKLIAAHVCCPPAVISRFVVPVVQAVIDTWTRWRTRVHNVPESEIVSVLTEYGIQKEMLPTVMGGTLLLNPPEWIAQRRAAEMEELP